MAWKGVKDSYTVKRTFPTEKNKGRTLSDPYPIKRLLRIICGVARILYVQEIPTTIFLSG